ncbi:MAG: heteromeric transposase endonuclease subunit TnsA [Desulfuromonas sp.]|uniref:TnsA endonuclease N-terminal domain-containing protein n=1 Tax=Desulfuromonas sp. TaxID=892 RepID=UPI000CC9E7E9|nr:TnsA endonuclease N-terminal domain-containing protein [Desulfuromonas sp.]PLX85591.1 MAG: heteromeric transposase endonuclease subunit TnsA [Desulfuromonas sp.]
MGRRRKVDQEKVQKKRLKEGRGQGRGKDYLPYLRVQDVPSLGFVTRAKGWKTGRVHHLMSNHEFNYFLLLEWSGNVVDIREQYPLLPIESTIEIADRLGIKHPADPRTKQPVVMTTDFVVDLEADSGLVQLARAIKPAADLAGKRTVEKLEIERTFWAERKIDWGLVTDRQIPKVLASNLRSLHAAWYRNNLPKDAIRQLARIEVTLFDKVAKGGQQMALSAKQTDELLGLAPGSSLATAKYLLARKMWKTDMKKSLNYSSTLNIRRR